jgi:mannose-6-phosphate isomerase-like protein (cupin superfamily)
MCRFLTVACATSALLPPVAVVADEGQAIDPEQILQAYVDDFRQDPAAAEAITFGIRVTGEGSGDWHVVVAGHRQPTSQPKPTGKDEPPTEPAAAKPRRTEEWAVTLKSGFPAEPIAYYVLDLATLRKLDGSELNALTAMAKTHGGETAPLDVGATPGFEPSPDFWARFLPLSFHFWTRGLPEQVPFRGELGREAHGANAVVFYYQKGFRSAWFQVTKGQHVNKDPQDQTNPFPSMFIMLRGSLESRIGGRQLTIQAGEMTFVPAGIAHEFWNAHDAPAEMIVLMFGEGA